MRITRNNESVRQLSPDSLLRAFFGLFYSFHTTEMMLGRDPDPQAMPAALQDQIEIFLHGIMK
jgi:hypothetical protein